MVLPEVQQKEPTFALHHGMLKMNSTVHKGIVDDSQKMFQKEWQSPTTTKNYGYTENLPAMNIGDENNLCIFFINFLYR